MGSIPDLVSSPCLKMWLKKKNQIKSKIMEKERDIRCWWQSEEKGLGPQANSFLIQLGPKVPIQNLKGLNPRFFPPSSFLVVIMADNNGQRYKGTEEKFVHVKYSRHRFKSSLSA